MITASDDGQLSQENLRKYLARLEEFIVTLEKKKGLDRVGKGIIVNELLLAECVKKTHDDLHRYSKTYNFSQNINTPNHFKQAAHLAFWIRRLRPLRIDIPEEELNVSRDYVIKKSLVINEEFSLSLGSWIAFVGEETNGYSPLRKVMRGGFFDDMIIMCKYKSLSPHALMMLFRAYFGHDDILSPKT